MHLEKLIESDFSSRIDVINRDWSRLINVTGRDGSMGLNFGSTVSYPRKRKFLYVSGPQSAHL